MKELYFGRQIWIKGIGMILLAQFENESGGVPVNSNMEFPCSISLSSELPQQLVNLDTWTYKNSCRKQCDITLAVNLYLKAKCCIGFA